MLNILAQVVNTSHEIWDAMRHTDIGRTRRSVLAEVNGVATTVEITGMLALLPTDVMKFIAAWETTSGFRPIEYRRLAESQLKHGFSSFPWKDPGMKTADGKYRLLPFVRTGFSLVQWIKDEFGTDFSKVWSRKNAVKVLKYLCQPVDLRSHWDLKVLVIPAETIPGADGCGWTTVRVLGGVMKTVGIGNNDAGDGVIVKGMLKHTRNFAEIGDVLPHIIKAFGNNFDTVVTTDTGKFAKPGVYQVRTFWHDDASRNVHNYVRVPEQLIRQADLTDEGKAEIVNILEGMRDAAKAAFAPGQDRGRRIGNWIGKIAADADFDGEDEDLNAIVGDVAGLIRTGIPFAWHDRIAANVQGAIGGILKRGTLGGVKLPGSMGFVLFNNTLKEDEIVLPRTFARKAGLRPGDRVVTWKSPLGPRSLTVRTVAGVVAGNWFEVNAHYNFDFDGDRISVTAIPLISKNWTPDPEQLEYASNLIEMAIRGNSTEVKFPENGSALEQTVALYSGLDQAAMVGLAERIRATVNLTCPNRELEHMFFNEIEEGILISGKKHGTDIVVALGGIRKDLVGRTKRPMFHKLLCDGRQVEMIEDEMGDRVPTSTWTAKCMGLEIAERLPVSHPNGEIYALGVEIAGFILRGLQVSVEDKALDADLNGKIIKVWASILPTIPVDKQERIKDQLVDEKLNLFGFLRTEKEAAKAFVRSLNPNDPDRSKKMAAFRKDQKARFGRLLVSKESRQAALLGVLRWHLYSLIYWFRPSEINEIIELAKHIA